MIIKRKIFEKYEDFDFNIHYKSGDRVLLSAGDDIKEGTEMVRKNASNIKYSFHLPEQIGSQLDQIEACISCIDGEYVNEGDVLAEKTVAGGLSVRKLISPAPGVVDLSRIASGYLDILGEESNTVLKSNFKGKVINVNPIEGIRIHSSALAMDLLSISDLFENNREKDSKKIFGEFTILGEGKDLVLKAEDHSYQNKIVFAGKYLHPELLYDLFEKGAAFVLTYSMNYMDFRRQGLPVGILGGFGEIHSSTKLIDMLSSLNGKFAIIDYDESQIFFVVDQYPGKKTKENFVQNLNGAQVKSLSLSNYGMVGNIVGTEEESSYVTVEWENGLRSIMNTGSVEFISF